MQTRPRKPLILDAEDSYWREQFAREPYVDRALNYDDYAAAFRVGYEGYAHRRGSFQANERELQFEWDQLKGKSRLTWDTAKRAAKAAWTRAERALVGDANWNGGPQVPPDPLRRP